MNKYGYNTFWPTSPAGYTLQDLVAVINACKATFKYASSVKRVILEKCHIGTTTPSIDVSFDFLSVKKTNIVKMYFSSHSSIQVNHEFLYCKYWLRYYSI